ncbi:MAG: ethylbenzene dehydrogenase-related protein [Halobacteriales archaeon]
MRREVLAALLVLSAVVLVAAVALPAVTEARPAFEIPVYHADEAGDLDRVDGTDWTATPAASVPLASAGAAVPGGEDTTVDRIDVKAARTDDRLYLRLAWPDPSPDRSTDRIRAFADAVAVQLPVEETERPPIAMGGLDNQVNVWFWRADGTVEELLAGGVGTTTRFEDPMLNADATHADGRWRVVMDRPLEPTGSNRTAISTETDVDVALAAWNGSNLERSGQKAASEWYHLALGPGPSGPPFEMILWTIAGLAIVFTTLVTIEGIRRTRGEG